ncbi:MAG: GxxExxY protein [Chthoniobacterales bacterium]
MTELTEFTELEGKEYDLAGEVIGAAMKVHRVLGHGFLEAVYLNALAHELLTCGHAIRTQVPLEVRYDDVVVGNYVADLMIGDALIIEIKAVQALAKAHEAQLVNYLTATRIDVGLLLNFGAASLEFRRKARIYSPPNSVNSVNSV